MSQKLWEMANILKHYEDEGKEVYIMTKKDIMDTVEELVEKENIKKHLRGDVNAERKQNK